MKKFLIVPVIIMFLFSCEKPEKISGENINLISIYNGLKKNNIFTKFIGYYIVRRDGGDQFFYNDLSDSTSWEPSVLYKGEDKKLDFNAKIFFEKFPNARLQFDIMKKYNIKAVITDNYNPESKRLEYNENGGYDFSYYALSFKLSDSISIDNINFNLNEYFRMVRNKYEVIKKLDSNWLVLKRL